MKNLFFDSWESIIRTIVTTVLAYFFLIICLRNFGKRTLAKMNAFDFVVTIALGSILATVMLSKDVALADGVLAFFLLITLQYCITWLSVRNKGINKLIKSSPALLLYNGKIIREIMKQERIHDDDIFAALRKKGLTSLKDAEAIVLETDGTLTVLQQLQSLKDDALMNLQVSKEVPEVSP